MYLVSSDLPVLTDDGGVSEVSVAPQPPSPVEPADVRREVRLQVFVLQLDLQLFPHGCDSALAVTL